MQFFTEYTYSVGFPFMWWGILSSIQWSEKNIKIFKIEKMAAVYWKFWKWIFSNRPPSNFFFFFLLLIIWSTYSPSLASGKQFLHIEKKSKLLFFSKTNEKRNKYSGLVVILGKKMLQTATLITERDKLFWSVVVDKLLMKFLMKSLMKFLMKSLMKFLLWSFSQIRAHSSIPRVNFIYREDHVYRILLRVFNNRNT